MNPCPLRLGAFKPALPSLRLPAVNPAPLSFLCYAAGPSGSCFSGTKTSSCPLWLPASSLSSHHAFHPLFQASPPLIAAPGLQSRYPELLSSLCSAARPSGSCVSGTSFFRCLSAAAGPSGSCVSGTSFFDASLLLQDRPGAVFRVPRRALVVVAPFLPLLGSSSFVTLLPPTRTPVTTTPTLVATLTPRGAPRWELQRWGGVQEFDCADDGPQSIVGVSDGTQFRPGLSGKETLRLFVPEVFRSVAMRPAGEVCAPAFETREGVLCDGAQVRPKLSGKESPRLLVSEVFCSVAMQPAGEVCAPSLSNKRGCSCLKRGCAVCDGAQVRPGLSGKETLRLFVSQVFCSVPTLPAVEACTLCPSNTRCLSNACCPSLTEPNTLRWGRLSRRVFGACSGHDYLWSRSASL